VRQRLSVITLGVTDPDRAAAFYAGLGWQQINDGGGATAPRIFKLGAQTLLALYDWNPLAEDATLEPSAAASFRGVTLAQCLESPEAVDTALADAERAGATILKPAAPTFWGGYGGYFADPDGQVWEIAHNPWWFDAEGNVIADQPRPTD
jgi:hypothetical protein